MTDRQIEKQREDINSLLWQSTLPYTATKKCSHIYFILQSTQYGKPCTNYNRSAVQCKIM